jgi:hypothetical protein
MPTLPQLGGGNWITKLDTSSPDKRLNTPPGLFSESQEARPKSANRVVETNRPSREKVVAHDSGNVSNRAVSQSLRLRR